MSDNIGDVAPGQTAQRLAKRNMRRYGAARKPKVERELLKVALFNLAFTDGEKERHAWWRIAANDAAHTEGARFGCGSCLAVGETG